MEELELRVQTGLRKPYTCSSHDHYATRVDNVREGWEVTFGNCACNFRPWTATSSPHSAKMSELCGGTNNLHRHLIPDDTVVTVIPTFQMWMNSLPSPKTSDFLPTPLEFLGSCFHLSTTRMNKGKPHHKSHVEKNKPRLQTKRAWKFWKPRLAKCKQRQSNWSYV
jgi:hypothetical protein